MRRHFFYFLGKVKAGLIEAWLVLTEIPYRETWLRSFRHIRAKTTRYYIRRLNVARAICFIPELLTVILSWAVEEKMKPAV